MSQLIGYARVSTPEQSHDRQLHELHAHGCDRVFAEAASGKRGAHPPQWDACLAHLRAGDTLLRTGGSAAVDVLAIDRESPDSSATEVP
jgi:DNA invertase Pin-like site-specific DNA recombinase